MESEGGANSSGARDATAAALDERWSDHWKAKQARATGPAPGTAAAPAALNYSASWPFARSTHKWPSAPSAPAAPASYYPNPAAPTSVPIPSASGMGQQQAMLTEVLDGMSVEEEFEELLGCALTSSLPKG